MMRVSSRLGRIKLLKCCFQLALWSVHHYDIHNACVILYLCQLDNSLIRVFESIERRTGMICPQIGRRNSAPSGSTSRFPSMFPSYAPFWIGSVFYLKLSFHVHKIQLLNLLLPLISYIHTPSHTYIDIQTHTYVHLYVRTHARTYIYTYADI
jgi:hypothetical protein